MRLLLLSLSILFLSALLTLLLNRTNSWSKISFFSGLFLFSGLGGLALWRVLKKTGVSDLRWNWPLPGASFHIGLDSLSCFFLLLILLAGLCCGIYGESYLSHDSHAPKAAARFFFLFLIGSMSLLIISRNAVLFMISWELMSLSAFGLISSDYTGPESSKAGLIYLLCAHIGALALLFLFAFLGSRAGSLEFSAFSLAQPLSQTQQTALLIISLIGFGSKAGFLPLHFWLQEAHPAAPSHASAIMSGVMIEMGVYGFLRLWSLLGPVSPSAGILMIFLGISGAVFGAVWALMQRDFKRLLAYSSIENIGIILAAAGLGYYGLSRRDFPLAVLGFSAALFHTFNHGLFKPLLFLSAGNVYQQAKTRDIEELGGLQKKMPLTGILSAAGCAALCGLPPFNGIISEYLIYSGFLRPSTKETALFLSFSASLLAFAGAVALAAFSKYYGFIFLGNPRSEKAALAREAEPCMIFPMAILAALCLLIGIFPNTIFSFAFKSAQSLINSPMNLSGTYEASLQNLDLIAGAGTLLLAAALLLWFLRGILLGAKIIKQGPIWACGFDSPSARMQYTGSSYAMPLQRILSPLLPVREKSHPPIGYWPQESSFESRTPDPALEIWIPVFIRAFSERLSRPRKIHHGKIQYYLLYMSAFLIFLLLWKL